MGVIHGVQLAVGRPAQDGDHRMIYRASTLYLSPLSTRGDIGYPEQIGVPLAFDLSPIDTPGSFNPIILANKISVDRELVIDKTRVVGGMSSLCR